MDYEQAREQAIIYVMSDLDGACRSKIYSVSQRMAGEYAPYPPAHLVTLARYVHVLAYRIFNCTRHPDSIYKHVGGNTDGDQYDDYTKHEFLKYIQAVFQLNDAIDKAARNGRLRLRDRAMGTVLSDWPIPSNDKAAALQRAFIYDCDDRAAAEILFDWTITYPHFHDSIVIAPAEFLQWLSDEGISSPEEAAPLLTALSKAKFWRRPSMGFPEKIVPLIPEQDEAAPVPTETQAAPATYKAAEGITKEQVLIAFESLVSCIDLKKALGNGKGLFGESGARTQKGARGGKHDALWNPVTLAVGLNENYSVPWPHLKRAFFDHPFLSKWADEWRDKLDLLDE